MGYLIDVRGYNYPDAVCAVLNENAMERFIPPKTKPPPERKPFRLPLRHQNNRRVVAYLQSRGIDKEVILDCINRGNLYEVKASGWDEGFYEEHRTEITLHRAAKKFFDELELATLPKMTALKQEYAILAAEKKKLYTGYRAKKQAMRELVTAKANCARLLDVKNDEPKRDGSPDKTR